MEDVWYQNSAPQIHIHHSSEETHPNGFIWPEVSVFKTGSSCLLRKFSVQMYGINSIQENLMHQEMKAELEKSYREYSCVGVDLARVDVGEGHELTQSKLL
ncbi:hypothetical protein ACOSQ3_008747 [Xanthoceras sorbifolium]